jgi:energy-coupling factor transporter ATP-binding protein EcfA2
MELQRLGLEAGIDPRRCNPGGEQLAFYGVALRGKTKAADVAKVLPELVRAISRSRRKRTHLRFDDILLRLEAEHPTKRPLEWLPSTMRQTKPHSATLGVSHYDGERPVSFSFDDVPQVLVAGETGSGKTVLVRNLITSLCYATSPDELRLVLVDPKNEDLRPFAELPHCLLFAGRQNEVETAIQRVAAEVQARIDSPSRKPYRLLLVVDELAQLTNINGAIKQLGDIMSIGRSKLVNAVVCTQQPTEEGGMGSMMKANVPLRLIGAVSAGQSYTATRRKGAGADMLPGNGSFLFIKGLDLYRFQSYFMSGLDEQNAIAMVQQRWGIAQREPVTPLVTAASVTGYATGYGASHTSDNGAGAVTSDGNQFPIREGRPLTPQEAATVRAMAASGDYDWRGELSINRLCEAVYGSKGRERPEWIKAALNDSPRRDDGKVIKLRKAV